MACLWDGVATPNAAVRYSYTVRGGLAASAENGQTTAYTYDAAGNCIKAESPKGVRAPALVGSRSFLEERAAG